MFDVKTCYFWCSISFVCLICGFIFFIFVLVIIDVVFVSIRVAGSFSPTKTKPLGWLYSVEAQCTVIEGLSLWGPISKVFGHLRYQYP